MQADTMVFHRTALALLAAGAVLLSTAHGQSYASASASASVSGDGTAKADSKAEAYGGATATANAEAVTYSSPDKYKEKYGVLSLTSCAAACVHWCCPRYLLVPEAGTPPA
jgi:hypothetical protein